MQTTCSVVNDSYFNRRYVHATTGAVPLSILIFGNLGIALVAGSAAALNHVADQHIDKLMKRTQYRPIAQGKISTRNSLIFSGVMCFVGMEF